MPAKRWITLLLEPFAGWGEEREGLDDLLAFFSWPKSKGVPSSFQYDLYQDHVVITGFNGSEGSPIMPERMEGLPVTGIGDNTFSCCSALTSITIPDSVTSIGCKAFSRCSALTGLKLPDSVMGIGDYAFSGCGNLTDVAIPDSVTSIGQDVFEDSPHVVIRCWEGAEADQYCTENGIAAEYF